MFSLWPLQPGRVSDAATAALGGEASAGEQTTAAVELFDSSVVHDISISYDEDDYEEMIATFSDTGEKDWIEAYVTIDGVTYSRAGIRLKGNSSLMSLMGDLPGPGPGAGGPGGDASANEPEQLPWLIRLDKYVDGQNHNGIFGLVVRSNVTETSLNEAVALELLDLAGLASQDAVAVRFTVNGSSAVLRLVVEHPDDVWMSDEFSDAGALYKAESTGDYSYRGDDPDEYDEVFDQEAGKDNTDLTPLIGFLAFINEADDVTFAAELGEHLDVDAFATYLAMQELIDNFDDIDGPGNNSYLYYDPDTEHFTVVPWDHNLSFAAIGGEGMIAVGPDGFVDGDAGGFIVGGPGRGVPPGGFPTAPPEGFPTELPDGVLEMGPGGPLGGNVLAERFLAVDEFADLFEERQTELRTALYESGAAAEILGSWVELLTTQAADLVDPGTVTEEADAISGIIDGTG